MNLAFLEDFEDAYLKTPQGKGVFLAGVLLGYIASRQAGGEDSIKNAPLFKQLDFGRMNLSRLKKIMARVPTLVHHYDIQPSHLVNALAAEAGRLILAGGSKDLGADGNFAFTVGFGNGVEYFWKIFRKKESEKDED